jgi:hypothetical protein
MRTCKLCSVRNCINDLIVNVALKSLYIHEVGGKKMTTMMHDCLGRQRLQSAIGNGNG